MGAISQNTEALHSNILHMLAENLYIYRIIVYGFMQQRQIAVYVAGKNISAICCPKMYNFTNIT